MQLHNPSAGFIQKRLMKDQETQYIQKHSLYMYINLHLLKPTCLIGSMGCFSVLGSILILPVLILRFSACGFIRNLESGLFEVTRGGLRGRENTSWSKECLKSIELMFRNYGSNTVTLFAQVKIIQTLGTISIH